MAGVKEVGQSKCFDILGTSLRYPGAMPVVTAAESRERERQVFRLRKKGLTFIDIDRRLGITNSRRVYERVMQRDVKDNPMHLARAVRLEEARLDDLTRAVADAAQAGDIPAIYAALRIMERRAKMLGLDYSDKLETQRLQLDEDRVKLMALAFSRALEAIQATDQQRIVATTVLMSTLRGITGEDAGLLYETGS